MPDYLLAAEWKKAIKSVPEIKGADDLTKLMDAYARAEDATEKKVVAIDAVWEKAKELRIKNAKNREIADYLDDVLGAADKAKVVARKEALAAEEPKFDLLLLKQLKLVVRLDREKARHFVVALGKPAGLAISKVAITKKQKTMAREWRTGKGKLLIGLVYGEGGRYVFELEDRPPGGLAAMIKRGVKIQAGKPIKLKVRGGGVDVDDEADLGELEDLGEDAPDGPDPELSAADLADEDDDADDLGDDIPDGADGTPPTPPEAPSADPAEFAAGARILKDRLDRVKALAPDRWPALNARFLQAIGAGQARQYAAGIELLEALLPDVDAAVAAGGGGGPGEQAAFDARLKGLLQRAIGLGLGAEVKLLASEASVFARKKDFAGAGERLDAIEARLAGGRAGAGAGAGSGDSAAADPKVMARAEALAGRLDALARDDEAAVEPLRGGLDRARDAARAGRNDEAEEALDVLEARAKGVARAGEAAKEILSAGATRTVGFRVARESWDKARQIARVQMGKFSAALLSDPQAQADESWPDIEAGAQGLVPMLDLFDDSLAREIAEAEATTDPVALRSHLQEVAALIVDYRQELSENPIYGVMDNGAYGTFKVHELMTKALDQAAAKLGI